MRATAMSPIRRPRAVASILVSPPRPGHAPSDRPGVGHGEPAKLPSDGHEAGLAVVVMRKREKIFRTVAFNDVVVSRGGMGSMIEFEVYVDGKFVYILRSDGLIICTPTGSTAYALSSGGPILHPSLPAMALVPIAPHTLSNRPIVLPKSATVTVVILKGHDPRVNFDVQSHFELQPGDKVEIKAHRHPIRLLHPEGYSYFAMLREKLHWSEKL